MRRGSPSTRCHFLRETVGISERRRDPVALDAVELAPSQLAEAGPRRARRDRRARLTSATITPNACCTLAERAIPISS